MSFSVWCGSHELLTMQAEPASTIKSAKGKRYRLPESDCSVDELVTVLTKWFEREGTRCIPTLLDAVTKMWPARGMPSAHLLCLSAAYGFALLLSAVDSTLHPRHAKLTSAILDVHAKEACFAGGRDRSEVRAMIWQRICCACARSTGTSSPMPRRRSQYVDHRPLQNGE